MASKVTPAEYAKGLQQRDLETTGMISKVKSAFGPFPVAMSVTSLQRRVKKLERAIDDVLTEVFVDHRCPYCGTAQCWKTELERVRDEPL